MPEQTRTRKFLAFVLRHAPARFDLSMDHAGWVDVASLLAACNANGHPLTPALLASLVSRDARQRYEFSDDNVQIRVSQGHPVPVDLGYPPVVPPAILFHGTAIRYLDAILRDGLQKGSRHHVHLSRDAETALAVAARHNEAVILMIDAGRLYQDGGVFYQSANGVWLVESVPPTYLTALAPPASNSA